MCGEDTLVSCESSGARRSLMPSHPGRSLDGITGNWIVFHLLWEQPGWDPPSLPLFPQIPAAVVILPPSRCTPFASHYTDTLHRPPPALTCHGKFPRAMQKHKVLNKASACTIPAAAAAAVEPQQRAVYHPNVIHCNMLRSCVVMLNFCCTNLSFLPQKFCEERWMKGRFGNGDKRRAKGSYQ